MQDYNQALAFIAAVAGDPNTAILDFRAIHDTDKTVPAIPFRGSLHDCWSSICHYNGQGYGIFTTIAAMDGIGRELTNVQYLRAHYIDLDNLSAQQNYEHAATWWPSPGFAVKSSPGKFHIYWPIIPYSGNDRFQLVQRKLRQLFDGDKRVIDAARVMRLPGSIHLKDPTRPHLVTCHALAGYGQPLAVDTLENVLASVNVIDGGNGVRHELGEPSLAAPNMNWLDTALKLIDPNSLDRGDWIALTSAIKQAGWTLTDPDTLFNIWSQWCAQYTQNDIGENRKQWDSIRNTELGWHSIVNRVPSLRAIFTFHGIDRTSQLPGAASPLATSESAPAAPTQPAVNGTSVAPPMPEPPALDCSGEILTDYEQREFFKGCVAIERAGEIMVPSGRFMNASKFNMKFGGKQFVISSTGKLTDEAWKAATRSTLWTVPKVDHVRFLPELKFGEIVTDQLGRKGVNTYIPINIKSKPGDVTPWLRHIELMLPIETDRQIIYQYLAHNVKFPGYKIPWAPMIQSTEGAGKSFIMEVLLAILGEMYCYSPRADELVNSGSTFNAWMRAKLLIVVNEIKVDERRELIEILKPMIADKRVEIQSKGIDQEMEDNPANWVFFSNFKNAIPVNRNGRRYAIMYSAIQSAYDLLVRGMDDAYFNRLFTWLENGGSEHIAYWLLNYPIERGAIPMRAPQTSSMAEALALSRSPLERLILEAVEDGLPGFRGGWVSATAVANRIKATAAVGRAVSAQTIADVLEGMGYSARGRAPRPYFQEDREIRAHLFSVGAVGDVEGYGAAQGWG